jgi:hypothetical protein
MSPQDEPKAGYEGPAAWANVLEVGDVTVMSDTAAEQAVMFRIGDPHGTHQFMMTPQEAVQLAMNLLGQVQAMGDTDVEGMLSKRFPNRASKRE